MRPCDVCPLNEHHLSSGRPAALLRPPSPSLALPHPSSPRPVTEQMQDALPDCPMSPTRGHFLMCSIANLTRNCN